MTELFAGLSTIQMRLAAGNAIAGTTSQLRTLMNDSINVKDSAYGATGNGVTDDTTAILAAIAAVKLAGGGIVYFPLGSYAISSTLLIDSDGIFLKGDGAGNALAPNAVALRASAQTTIKWIGATGGTMAKYTSDDGDTGLGLLLGGGGMSDIFLDGREFAGICLELHSWAYGNFRNIHAAWARTFGYKFWTLVNGVSQGAFDTHINKFDHIAYTELNTSQSPIGMIVGSGNTASNFSLNQFYSPRVSMDGGGNAVEIEDADSNTFFGASFGQRTGGGGKTILHATDTGQLPGAAHARYNSFYGPIMAIIAKAIVSAGTDSEKNCAFGYNLGTANPEPVIESGAEFSWISTEEIRGFPATAQAIGDISSRAKLAQAAITTEALYIYGASSNHCTLTDGTNTWGINIDVSNGNLRFLRKAGSGFPDFPNSVFLIDGVTKIASSTNTPEGAITANVGSIFLRKDGGTGTTFYVKESGVGNTGWVAK